MRAYQTLGLLVLVSGLSFLAGWSLGQGWQPPSGVATAHSHPDHECNTCALPDSLGKAAAANPAPKIPTGSGRPCLVEFGSDECKDCQRMEQVLAVFEPKMAGRLDVVRVDTDIYLAEVQRWRLRMIPTQVLVDPTGKELWRHEGYIPLEELIAATESRLDTKRAAAGAPR